MRTKTVMDQMNAEKPDDVLADLEAKHGSQQRVVRPTSEPIQCFIDSEIGMTMGDTTVRQLPDGTWKATCPIGTIFGAEVEGECNGTGATKEAALEALKQSRKNLNDSLWA